MSKVVLTDACYWLGLVDAKDQYHEASKTIRDLIKGYKIRVPWPCMFESVSTRLIRNRDGTLLFENLISKPEVELLDDNKYKQIALSMVFESNRQRGYSYSLVDSVIREILKDKEVQIDYLITYNEKDFADVCEHRNLRIISGN